jgi:hypothetical protein
MKKLTRERAMVEAIDAVLVRRRDRLRHAQPRFHPTQT